jgi:glycosyltransferase involved in cell wall biosynthesis
MIPSFVRSAVSRCFDAAWSRYSRLFIKDDAVGWVLSREAAELRGVARRLGIKLPPHQLSTVTERQCVFYADQFSLLDDRNYERPHRYAFAFFHGRPGSELPEFDRCFAQLKRIESRIQRIQVSHRAFREVLAGTGFPSDRIHVIPIGVNTRLFTRGDAADRSRVRAAHGIPDSAVVVGSFQKDGIGWGEGNEPKRIKGPDIFLKVIERLKPRVPELFVLLCGPARGYVKNGLAQLGVPFRHVQLPSYADVAKLYHALDAYLVTSREEGGPKSVLESMATGVPIVSTRVGQAADLIVHARNGWLVDIEDVEGLARWTEWVVNHRPEVSIVLDEAVRTADANSYAAQDPLWRDFFNAFVNYSC